MLFFGVGGKRGFRFPCFERGFWEGSVVGKGRLIMDGTRPRRAGAIPPSNGRHRTAPCRGRRGGMGDVAAPSPSDPPREFKREKARGRAGSRSPLLDLKIFPRRAWLFRFHVTALGGPEDDGLDANTVQYRRADDSLRGYAWTLDSTALLRGESVGRQVYGK
jgi:hypothetical protein